MPVAPLWRELSLTRSTLLERGLRVHGVWTVHIGLGTPPCVYVDWQTEPNRHERAVAENLVVARKIIHVERGGNKPRME